MKPWRFVLQQLGYWQLFNTVLTLWAERLSNGKNNWTKKKKIKTKLQVSTQFEFGRLKGLAIFSTLKVGVSENQFENTLNFYSYVKEMTHSRRLFYQFQLAMYKMLYLRAIGNCVSARSRRAKQVSFLSHDFLEM